MASSNNGKICVRCDHPLNHVGAWYRGNQNEKPPLQTILDQAQGLKLENLVSNIEENLQNKTPTFIRLSCRDYLTLSWRRPISYRNQPIDLLRKSMDWFLYDIGLRHERVKKNLIYKQFIRPFPSNTDDCFSNKEVRIFAD